MTKPGKTLKSDELARPSSFCWNEKRADYGRVDAGNLRKFGFTRKGRQRWQCTTCKKVVAETKGTVFHGKKHDEQTIIECFAMLPRSKFTRGHPSHQGRQGRDCQRLAPRSRATDGADRRGV